MPSTGALRERVVLSVCAWGGGFQQVLLRYAQALLTQVSQTAVCHRRHTIPQRLWRWLLLTLERVPGDRVQITQELLAQMLAVRRPSVTEVGRGMHMEGIIAGGRGVMTILDRTGVDARVCECYATVEKEARRLLEQEERTCPLPPNGP